MGTIKPESASHWYTTLGEPCHEVPRADGKGTRATTLADARKLGLLPSVTNVLSVLNKPYLNAWKATQYIEAFMDVVNGTDGWQDLAEDRVAAAVELAEQRMAMPRDLGTLYHAAIADTIQCIENNHSGIRVWPPEVDMVTLTAVVNWYAQHCLNGTSEKPFASADGYGGCVDWYGFYRDLPGDDPWFAVVDFKTQATTPGKPVRSYNEWAVQLAAYARGIGTENALLYNLVISTTEPGRIQLIEWPEGVEYWYWNFQKVFAVWRSALGKGYDPRSQ